MPFLAVRYVCKQENTEDTIMRHCYFRILLGLVWMVAAIASGVRGNLSMTVLYGVLALVFHYTAYAIWKKEKANRR